MSDDKRTAAATERDRWLRRQAVQIVAQLPENEQDALQIIAYARELQAQFIGNDIGRRELRALRLVSNFEDEASSSPSSQLKL